MQRLLAWAKANGHMVTSAQVGTVSVELAVMQARSSITTTEDARQGIYDEFGGELMKKLKEQEAEYEPAVQS
jgi:hypothetical protein